MNTKIIPILLLTFVNTLGFAIMVPVFPFMVREWGFADWVFGILVAIYSLCQFWAAPIFGELSDQYGRRTLLLYSQAGTLAAWCIFIGAWYVDVQLGMITLIPLLVIVFARFVDGITGGNSSVASAYLADVATPEQKTKYFSYISAIAGIGIIIGPAIGAYTVATSLGYLATGLFGAGLSAITLAALYFWLPESGHVRSAPKPIVWSKPFHVLRTFTELTDHPLIINVLIIRLFIAGVMGAYTSVMVFFLIDAFAFSEQSIGNFLFAVGVFSIFNQMVVVGKAERFFGPARALAVGLCLSGLGLFAFPFVGSVALLVSFYYLTNLGISITMPTIKSVLSNQSSDQEQGKILGLDESFNSLMFGIMPIVSTFVYSVLGVQSFLVWGGLAFVALAFLVVRCRDAFLPHHKPQPQPILTEIKYL